MLVESKSSETMGYWTIGITIIGLYLGARRRFKVKQIRKKISFFRKMVCTNILQIEKKNSMRERQHFYRVLFQWTAF